LPTSLRIDRRSLAALTLVALFGTAPAQAAPDSGQPRFRALYQELIETDTSLSNGSCTLAAQRMQARLTAAGYAPDQFRVVVPPHFAKQGSLVGQIPGTDAKAGETMFDLGSGDGRIVIMAAQKYKAKGIGVEYDASLAKQSQDRIKTLGLTNLASIIKGDLLQQHYESADLVTVYLLPVGNDLATAMLEKQLKKGARVVAHDFEFMAWKPTRVEDVDDDGEGRSHRLYLYQR